MQLCLKYKQSRGPKYVYLARPVSVRVHRAVSLVMTIGKICWELQGGHSAQDSEGKSRRDHVGTNNGYGDW